MRSIWMHIADGKAAGGGGSYLEFGDLIYVPVQNMREQNKYLEGDELELVDPVAAV